MQASLFPELATEPPPTTDVGPAVDAALGALSAPLKATTVAAVPHWSPFRYPGGKTWLVPTIRRWLWQRRSPPVLFLEPFAGGGSVSLAVAGERLAERILMVERDAEVAAVWSTILTGDADAFATRVLAFDLGAYTPSQLLTLLAPPAHPEREAGGAIPPAPTPPQGLTLAPDNREEMEEKAFRTLLRNRLAYGGLLTADAGHLRQGEDGRGLASRWYPKTLRRRILAIRHIADHLTPITFVEGDGIAILRAHVATPGVMIFLDPPYTAGTQGKRAGRRLYTHWALDHEALFRLAATVCGEVLLTYDDTPEVRELAARHGFMIRQVAMKTTHHVQTTELLIARAFDWLDDEAAL